MKQRWWIVMGALALFSQSVGARIYKWVDEHGKVQYTQTPPPDGPVRRFEIRPEPLDTAGALKKLKAQKEKSDAFFKDRDKQTKEREKSEEEAAKLSEQCARARENLTQLETRNRLFRPGEAGARIKMTEEERQVGMTKAKSQIEEFCKRKASKN